MKIRYSNGFSLSLWNDEYLELIVEEDYMSYLTAEGKWIKIRIPSTWSQGSSSSHSKVIEDGPSLNNEAIGAGVRDEQAYPTRLNPPKENQNEQLTAIAEESELQDEIAKLKRDIEKLLQKDFCELPDVQSKFDFIGKTFTLIETHHNNLEKRVLHIEKSLHYLSGGDDDEDDSLIQPIRPLPLNPYPNTSHNKTPEPIFHTKKKKKKN